LVKHLTGCINHQAVTGKQQAGGSLTLRLRKIHSFTLSWPRQFENIVYEQAANSTINKLLQQNLTANFI